MASRKSMFWALCSTFIALSIADGVERKLETTLYPDCSSYPVCREAISQNASDANASFPNVAYVRASAGADVLHFVMSTIGIPTILVVHTLGDPNQRLGFNWTELLANGTAHRKGAVYTNDTLYHGRLTYSFGLTFTRLIEYDDIDDSASLKHMEEKYGDKPNMWNKRNFTEFTWMNVTQGQGGNSIIFNTTQPQLEPYPNQTAGCMYFEFEFNNGSGRDSDLPRLIFNSNNTQMNFVLDKYVPLFNKSRFALEMSILANNSTHGMSVNELRSIDDEFSPGVFRVVNWYTAGEGNSSGGYMQWKPVCYLEAERSRAVGSEVTRYPLQKSGGVEVALLADSLAQAFFGPALNSTLVLRSANVSFGLSQDGFYLKKNYTVWTTSVGYGKPPLEGISTLVIIIIAAGLGIPFILIVFGGIFVCARKRRRNGYEELNSSNPRLN